MAGNKNSGGSNKLSTNAHVLRGTFRADRHAGDTTPEPPKGRPEPPIPLVGAAKAEWTRMLDRLEKNNTLSIVDDAALFQYAELFGETQEIKTDNSRLRKMSVTLMAMVKRLQGSELVETIGRIVDIEHELSRQATKLRQNRMALRQWLVEFGMTPSARTRVKQNAGPAAPKSRVDQFRQSKSSPA